MEIKTLVSRFDQVVHIASAVAPTTATGLPQHQGHPRTQEKPSLENWDLASLWEQRLTSQGWSVKNVVHSKADNAWCSYSSAARKVQEFLHCKGFSLENAPKHILADYLCELAGASSRPQGILRTFSAAVHAYGLGTETTLSDNLYKVIDGLIKN